MKHHDIAIFVSLFSIPYFDDNLCLNPNLNDIYDDTYVLLMIVISSISWVQMHQKSQKFTLLSTRGPHTHNTRCTVTPSMISTSSSLSLSFSFAVLQIDTIQLSSLCPSWFQSRLGPLQGLFENSKKDQQTLSYNPTNPPTTTHSPITSQSSQNYLM